MADATLAKQSNLISNISGTGFGSMKNDFKNQIDGVASGIYGTLQSSAKANQASYYYNTRTNDLLNVQNSVLNNVTTQADVSQQNSDTSLRQREINEWANSDKLDTLFVFQFLFISLMMMALLGYLWRINLLSSGFLYFFGFLLLVVNIFIIVIRSKYTRYLRNTRYWNRRKFNQYPAPPPQPPPIQICGTGAGALIDTSTGA